MTSLLEEAKKVKIGKPIRGATSDQIELAIAWVKDEITLTQITLVISPDKNHASDSYRMLALSLRSLLKEERFREVLNQN